MGRKKGNPKKEKAAFKPTLSTIAFELGEPTVQYTRDELLALRTSPLSANSPNNVPYGEWSLSNNRSIGNWLEERMKREESASTSAAPVDTTAQQEVSACRDYLPRYSNNQTSRITSDKVCHARSGKLPAQKPTPDDRRYAPKSLSSGTYDNMFALLAEAGEEGKTKPAP